ncbi:hypothetical protein CLU79DRAFT_737956 [Phycomyces nitens]|nr:hypothetical protein CLU79DRAFT_737956 [Phycomyces nitens]
MRPVIPKFLLLLLFLLPLVPILLFLSQSSIMFPLPLFPLFPFPIPLCPILLQPPLSHSLPKWKFLTNMSTCLQYSVKPKLKYYQNIVSTTWKSNLLKVLYPRGGQFTT